MTPTEQIQTLQQMVLESQEHNLRLIEENATLRAKVEIPRDMQQEANLLAVDNADAALKGRILYLEGELARVRLALGDAERMLEEQAGVEGETVAPPEVTA